MKSALYKFREGIFDLFRYPQEHLKHFKVDYDAYWVDKRGASLGALTRWQRQRADLALLHIPRGTPVSFTDVGCGDGSVLAYLKTKVQTSRIVGIDVSSTALVKARAQGVETILVGNDLKEAVAVVPQTDFIILFEVLEHMPNAEQFLAAMVEKATHGVFFSFPNTGYLAHRLRLLFGRFPMQWRLHPSEHLRFWTYRDLLWWLKAQNYHTYKLHVYEGVPLLNRVFPSLFGRGLFVYIPKQQK